MLRVLPSCLSLLATVTIVLQEVEDLRPVSGKLGWPAELHTWLPVHLHHRSVTAVRDARSLPEVLGDLGPLEVALGRDPGYADSSHSDAICLLQSQLAWQRDLTHLLHFVLTRTDLFAAVTAR